MSTAALMYLIYLGTGWLGVPESHRMQVALWGGGILSVLGALAGFLLKTLPQAGGKTGNSPSRKPTIPQGRFTAGFSGDDLRPTEGGRNNMYCRLVVGYADAKSDVTSRIIDVQAFTVAATPDGEVVPYNLDAYCELRKAQRNFRADRIVECKLADAEDAESDVKDLMATLMAAPATTICDNQTAIIRPIAMPDLVLDYMFRTPNYRRVNIRPVSFGYTERSRGNRRERTLLFIDGIAEGKTQQQRFRTERIKSVWQAGHENPEGNIAALFLPGQRAD
ncbi:hypothetical protein FOH24_07140 [Acetobacter tropicalis]|nr:hypothetical protein [Acetobacter tropicalis]KAA8387062.1 hypothetical protein FOH22_10485 [Acetobacter tropicalis]KAA8391407.1 hypothetical protein FOH24_07140 [Acetobacter tropicalis]MBC9008768.1 hypothetical protein [Acetobacter tropicalis]MDO8171941.1 hypothetical protein [Acetobacter tropicalis]